MRRFFNVITSENGDEKETAYVTIENVMKSEKYRQQIVKTALREIVYWGNKYKDYQEFGLVFKVIKKIKKKIKL